MLRLGCCCCCGADRIITSLYDMTDLSNASLCLSMSSLSLYVYRSLRSPSTFDQRICVHAVIGLLELLASYCHFQWSIHARRTPLVSIQFSVFHQLNWKPVGILFSSDSFPGVSSLVALVHFFQNILLLILSCRCMLGLCLRSFVSICRG